MPLYTADALVLRTYKLGESDRIVVFLTEDRGKKRGVAKGARRPRSRFVGALEPLTQRAPGVLREGASRAGRARITPSRPARRSPHGPRRSGTSATSRNCSTSGRRTRDPNERLYRLGASLRRCPGRRVARRAAGALLRVLAAAAPGGVPVRRRLPGVRRRARRAGGGAYLAPGSGPVHLRRVRAGGAGARSRTLSPAALAFLRAARRMPPAGRDRGRRERRRARGARGGASHADGAAPRARAEINTRPAGPAACGARRCRARKRNRGVDLPGSHLQAVAVLGARRAACSSSRSTSRSAPARRIPRRCSACSARSTGASPTSSRRGVPTTGGSARTRTGCSSTTSSR